MYNGTVTLLVFSTKLTENVKDNIFWFVTFDDL